MRTVVISQTARTNFQTLLEQGAIDFGIAVAEEKARIVDENIHGYLARYPANGFYDKRRKIYAYPVDDTPFTVVYRFDDNELLVYFIVHKRADRRRLDPRRVSW